MKIALVCPYSFDVPGGVATHVRGLAAWLREQGHYVLVVAPGTDAPKPGELLVGASAPFRFNGSTANLALGSAQIRLALEHTRVADVVHVHEPLTPGLAYGVARRSERLVVTHHARFHPGPLAPLLRARAAWLWKRRRIAVSDAARATALAVTGERPDVIPNGIAMPPFNGKPASTMPVVLHVGRRDDRRKGYHVFEQVAKRMADEARFVAVGPGDATFEHVATYGQLLDQQRDGWLREAAVVMATNTFGESFGLVIAEGLANGCGIVASDLPEFRAVADDPRCTSWFPPGDVDAAVAALRARLREGTDAEAARHRAARYSWDQIGPRILEHYEHAALH